MGRIISTNVYIDKYQYRPIGCASLSSQPKEPAMDNETNLAAWMIGRGQPIPDPNDARDQIHRQALATARRHEHAPSVAGRVSSAVRSVVRREPAPAPQACCPA
jgi:hypothetical protein